MEWTISSAGVGSATSNGTKVVAFTGINSVTSGDLADTFTFPRPDALVQVDGGGGGEHARRPDRPAANTWVVSADDQGTLNGIPLRAGSEVSTAAAARTTSRSRPASPLSSSVGGGGDATDTLDFPAGVPTEVDTSFLGPGTGSSSATARPWPTPASS